MAVPQQRPEDHVSETTRHTLQHYRAVFFWLYLAIPGGATEDGWCGLQSAASNQQTRGSTNEHTMTGLHGPSVQGSKQLQATCIVCRQATPTGTKSGLNGCIFGLPLHDDSLAWSGQARTVIGLPILFKQNQQISGAEVDDWLNLSMQLTWRPEFVMESFLNIPRIDDVTPGKKGFPACPQSAIALAPRALDSAMSRPTLGANISLNNCAS